MSKYIIFQAEGDDPDWENRKLQHSQALTWIIAEHFDSSNSPIPEAGDRPLEFVRVDALHNPDEHAHSTHYRKGDWEVARVETYTPDVPMGEFDMIVICFCKYSPINAPLHPMPERQVSVDSFGGDDATYQHWLATEKQPATMTSP
jgi:hypothetical protein